MASVSSSGARGRLFPNLVESDALFIAAYEETKVHNPAPPAISYCHLLGGSKPSPLGEGFSVALR